VLLNKRDLDVLTRTLFGECRGEREVGQIAVAWVIRNRAEWPGKTWWGDTIADVCLKPSQFSCWLDSDPNRAKLEALSTDDPTYAKLYDIATRVLMCDVADPTGGCTHYEVVGTGAKWAKGKEPKVIIGRHAFYALGPGA
jgi:spore germination cell wall hydrolase CwlJ-like protein